MSAPLPEAFVARMREQLDDSESEAFFAALERPALRGLRLNPRKPLREPVEGLREIVPWEPLGRYLSMESAAGSAVWHEAGAYYLQEPSAMSPVSVLAPKPGERVLDLCAAPGGKSTQIAAHLGNEGLLVSNEPVPSRAQVLSRNVERLGIPNALVVSMQPQALAERWPSAFDAILVDAPCSGEGMFRRHPETRLAWSEGSAAGCASRQALILDSAVRMLKPGGRLVYSTCTFSPEENERTIRALLQRCPFLAVTPFFLPVGGGKRLEAPDGMMRLYPHQVQGEGHFVALLHWPRGESAQEETPFLPPCKALERPDAQMATAYSLLAAQWKSPYEANAALGQTLLCAPELPPLRGIRVLRAGVALGAMKGKLFFPDHALAMALPFPTEGAALTERQARAYQAGETLPLENGVRSGFWPVTVSGLALGFAKGADGQLKNHYPKGLRRPDHS